MTDEEKLKYAESLSPFQFGVAMDVEDATKDPVIRGKIADIAKRLYHLDQPCD